MTTSTKLKGEVFPPAVIRALLAGATQVRTPVKNLKWIADTAPGVEPYWRLEAKDGSAHWDVNCPQSRDWLMENCPWEVGQRLWVREAWQAYEPQTQRFGGAGPMRGMVMRTFAYPPVEGESVIEYREGSNKMVGRWRSAMHMPQWASRLTLEIESIRVERVKDISEEDAIASGSQIPVSTFDPPLGGCLTERTAFANIWKRVYGPESWDANPWVWVRTVRVIR